MFGTCEMFTWSETHRSSETRMRSELFAVTRVWKATLLVLSMSVCLVSSALLSAPAACAAAGLKESSLATVDERSGSQEAEIRQVLIRLAAAVDEGNAANASSLWSEDGVFIDEGGGETRGRAALQERFAGTIKERAQASVQLHPEKISFPAGNVALVVGCASRKNGSADLPATRFSMVLLKQNGSWLIGEATETTIEDLKAADYLKELEWLVGKWQVDNPESPAKLEVDWGAGHNFIISKCTAGKVGAQQVDMQIIGWDPRSKGFVSWHFDCHGGFGYGKWSKQADGWQIEFAGVAANGNSTRATNTFALKNPEEFIWQSSQQSAEGVAIANTEALKIKKIRP
jgi:uncharacterized protein (TIGR02246 family)